MIALCDASFVAHGNVATAGGCLASHYLATGMIARMGNVADAQDAIHYVAPVGEKQAWVARAMAVVTPFLPDAQTLAA